MFKMFKMLEKTRQSVNSNSNTIANTIVDLLQKKGFSCESEQFVSIGFV